jgi:hypothetical protein
VIKLKLSDKLSIIKNSDGKILVEILVHDPETPARIPADHINSALEGTCSSRHYASYGINAYNTEAGGVVNIFQAGHSIAFTSDDLKNVLAIVRFAEAVAEAAKPTPPSGLQLC